MTSNFEETYVYDANGRRIEKHLFPNIKDSTVKKAIVLLGHEDEWDWDETVQTAFDGAQGMDISGGFFGIDADDEALEFGEEQLQAQMEEDRAQAATEMEILRTKNARLQAELDSARAGVWKVDNQAQVMALNAASTEYNNNYPSKRPSAQGPTLNSKSTSQIPQAQQAHPVLARVQTDGQVRHDPAPMDSDATGSRTTSRHGLKEGVQKPSPPSSSQRRW